LLQFTYRLEINENYPEVVLPRGREALARYSQSLERFKRGHGNESYADLAQQVTTMLTGLETSRPLVQAPYDSL
jgi:hypothetical protein